MTKQTLNSQINRIVVAITAAVIALLLFTPAAHADLDSVRNVSADNVTSNSATIKAQIYSLVGSFPDGSYYGNSYADVAYGTTETPDSSWQTTNTTTLSHAQAWQDYSQQISGFSPMQTIYYRVESWQPQQDGSAVPTDSPVQSFETGSGAATIEPGTLAVTKISQTTATLTAQVDANGAAATYHWAIGPMPGVYPTVTPETNLPAGSGYQPVSTIAHNLTPNSINYASLVVTNSNGTVSSSPIPFQTLAVRAPVVVSTSGESSAGDRGTATIAFSAEGATTTCWAEIATDAAYQATRYDNVVGVVPCSPDTQAGEGTLTATASFTGLTNLTGYHIQFVLNNSAGQTLAEATLRTNAPELSNVQVSDISSDGATISFDLNDHGEAADYAFNIGHGSVGSSSYQAKHFPALDGPQHVSFRDTGLTAATAYAFSIGIITDSGRADSSGSFTTLAAPAAPSSGSSSPAPAQSNPAYPVTLRIAAHGHNRVLVTGTGISPGKIKLYSVTKHGKQHFLKALTVAPTRFFRAKLRLDRKQRQLRLLVRSATGQPLSYLTGKKIGPVVYKPATMRARLVKYLPNGKRSQRVSKRGQRHQKHGRHQHGKTVKGQPTKN